MIVAPDISFSGSIDVSGGSSGCRSASGMWMAGGGGSGGSVRLRSQVLLGDGTINIDGGTTCATGGAGSAGRIRIDAYETSLTETADFAYGTREDLGYFGVSLSKEGVVTLTNLSGQTEKVRLTVLAN